MLSEPGGKVALKTSSEIPSFCLVQSGEKSLASPSSRSDSSVKSRNSHNSKSDGSRDSNSKAVPPRPDSNSDAGVVAAVTSHSPLPIDGGSSNVRKHKLTEENSVAAISEDKVITKKQRMESSSSLSSSISSHSETGKSHKQKHEESKESKRKESDLNTAVSSSQVCNHSLNILIFAFLLRRAVTGIYWGLLYVIIAFQSQALNIPAAEANSSAKKNHQRQATNATSSRKEKLPKPQLNKEQLDCHK